MSDDGDSMTTLYRLSWEMVGLAHLRHYSSADPALFKRTTQTVPNSQIPDEHWQPVSKETADPWRQYDMLRSWADADEGFVRRVRLERAAVAPTEREPVCTCRGGPHGGYTCPNCSGGPR